MLANSIQLFALQNVTLPQIWKLMPYSSNQTVTNQTFALKKYCAAVTAASAC